MPSTRRRIRAIAAAAIMGWSMPAMAAEVKLQDGTILPDKPTFVVTYIGVDAKQVDAALDLLKAQAKSSKAEAGSLRFEALQQIGEGGRFVMLEAWDTAEARAAHAAAAHTMAYRKALEPMLYAPYDERPHVGLVAADVAAIPAGTGDTVYVVTHADIIPPEQFAPCERQIDPAGPCGNTMMEGLAKFARTHDGNMRYDVLTQSNRPNHMSVVEMWDGLAAQEAHQINPEKKRFRNELAGIAPAGGVNADPLFTPNMLTGSLWDERLYKLIAD